MEQRNASVTEVASSASSVNLLAQSKGRVGAAIYNDSTAVLRIKFGTTAAADDFTTKIPPGYLYELPVWYTNGRVDGIWEAANGNAYVTEVI